ncbi:aldo/keto reductase [Enterobacteriaceae bacterium RIT697]|uniref:aldo/keto reductase n=1 Tax=Pantoea endophytica TaxID=92488 RepID=UPI0012ADCA29|nr:aldo/keto reductase [Pantoea endophytica]MRT24995.1 aldo/keto reductase [Enterobacteriaceae bacterium RIT697]
MRYNRLGRTGLFVSEMCIGTMTFGQSGGPYAAASGVLQKEAEAIMRRAFDAGINFIDTANVYASGQSEQIVGRALASLGIARKDVVLSTKFEHGTGPGPNDGGASRKHILHEVEGSLKRLGTDYIDLYQLHGFDPATPVEEMLRTLDDLVRQGYVRHVGVSNWAAWQLATALGKSESRRMERFQCYQGYYSLVGREIEREIMPLLESEGLGLMVFSPLAGGYLSGKYRRENGDGRRRTVPFPPVNEQQGGPILDLLEEIATRHSTSMAAVSLAWLLHQKTVTSVILGLKRIDQLEENLKAANLRLTEDDITALNTVSALSPEYPGWMMASGEGPRRAMMESGILSQDS